MDDFLSGAKRKLSGKVQHRIDWRVCLMWSGLFAGAIVVWLCAIAGMFVLANAFLDWLR